MKKSDITVKKVAYHRNGIMGESFHVILFSYLESLSSDRRNMVAMVFDNKYTCGVLDIDETAKGNIDFAMGNSWRGDYFEPFLRDAIKKYEDARNNENI
jgi:hypothetical protein